jgi:hypothetical protein
VYDLGDELSEIKSVEARHSVEVRRIPILILDLRLWAVRVKIGQRRIKNP